MSPWISAPEATTSCVVTSDRLNRIRYVLTCILPTDLNLIIRQIQVFSSTHATEEITDGMMR
jgi:hypothetical protein